MPMRLVSLNDGPDIIVDKPTIVVGRHRTCDTRLDSIRVSRHHCCITLLVGELAVKDLGSTNGIRINGHRVRIGRLRAGDELSIADFRYLLENGQGQSMTGTDAIGLEHTEGEGRRAPLDVSSGTPGCQPNDHSPSALNRSQTRIAFAARRDRRRRRSSSHAKACCR
jgi:pSer/pThr/pTyr-binding forkhead associated (FHA) protein